MTENTEPLALPAPVAAFLDGNDLAQKVGDAIILSSAAPGGRVRQALLSVGEVLAVGGDELMLLLYANSRTTAALTASGQGLLSLVVDGIPYRIQVDVDHVDDERVADIQQAVFRARVVEVDADTVGYSQVLSGVTFALHDTERVLDRWRKQVEELRSSR